MALASALISYDIADMVGADFDARRTKVWVTTNVAGGAVVDTVGNQIRIGDGLGTIAENGTGSVSVWVPGAGSNPASWQTYVHVDFSDRRPAAAGGKREVRTFGPFTITGNADLADLVAEQEVPPTYLDGVVATLQGYADAAEASAARAEDISNIDTPDALVASLASDGASQTSAAVAALIAAGVPPLVAAQVGPLVPPLVATAIASDPTVASSAAAAVTTAMAAQRLATYEDLGDGSSYAFLAMYASREAAHTITPTGDYFPVPKTSQDMATLREGTEGSGWRWYLRYDSGEVALGERTDGSRYPSGAGGTPDQSTLEVTRTARAGGRRSWLAALGGHRTAPARVLFLGDSIAEGYASTTYPSRIAGLVNQNLHDATKLGGGAGYIGAQTGGSGGALADNGWSDYPFAWNANAAPSPHGLGARGKVISTTSTGTLTLPLGTTGVDLLYTKGASALAGSFSYAVDGGSATTIACTAGSTTHANVVQIRSLNPATVHSITFAGVSGTCVLEGAFAFAGDEAAGIHVFEAGHRSLTSADWLNTSVVSYLDALTYVAPKVVVIELGVNDFRNGITSAAFLANIQTLIANIRAATTTSPSIMLVACWQCSATSPVEPWANYVAALYTIATTDPGIHVHDWWYDLTGHSTTPPTTTWSPDQCHPNQAASNLLSLTLTRTLQGANA